MTKRRRSRNLPAATHQQNRPAQHQGDRRTARIDAQSVELTRSFYQGPLPSPEDFRQYGEVHADAPAIILGTFNEQGIHRRNLEERLFTGAEKRSTIGQWLGFTLFGGAILGGCVLVGLGHDTAGAAIASAGLGSGALVYVVGGRSPKSE